MPQCNECGRSVEKIHKNYKSNKFCHSCYVRIFKNGNVHPAEVQIDYINMIIWQFAKNVKTTDHVYVANVLITL